MHSNVNRPTWRRRAARSATIAAALVVTLVGCASQPPAEGGGQDASGTVNFANWQFLETGKGELLWDAVKGYTGDSGKITIAKVEIPFANYVDKIGTEIGAGGGPDVMVLQDLQFVNLADAGALEPLDDIAAELSGSLNSTNEVGVYNDTQYGFVWERLTYNTVLYNKDIFTELGLEAPTDFDEFLTTTKTIKDELGVSGWAGRHMTSEIDGWTLEMSNWLYAFGGSLSDGTELTIDSANNEDAVHAFLETFASGVAPIGDDAATYRAKFGQGQVAMLFDNSSAAMTLANNPNSIVNGSNLGAALLPTPEGGSASQLMIGINAASKNKEAAKDFVRWILSEGQQSIRPALGASVLATDIQPSEEFLQANPWGLQFIESDRTTHGSTRVPGFETESNTIWRAFLTAVEDLRINGGDVSAKLTEVQDELERELG